MRIRKNTLKKIIAEASRLTEAGWKNADGSPWTPPPKSGSAGGVGMDDIETQMGTDFSLYDEDAMDLELDGNLLDPSDLRALADMLEKIYNGTMPVAGRVAFDVD